MITAPRTRRKACYLAGDGDVRSLREIVTHEGAHTLLRFEEMVSGWSAFHYAAMQGHLFVLEYLWEESGVGEQLAQTVALGGRTPLMIAASSGRVHVVEWLLADERRCSKKMALMATGDWYHTEQQTALHYAARSSRVDVNIVRLLATRFPDLILMVTDIGMTAADLAFINGNHHVAELLECLALPLHAQQDLECARAALRAVHEMQQEKEEDPEGEEGMRCLVEIVLRCFLVEDAEVVVHRCRAIDIDESRFCRPESALEDDDELY